MSHPYDEGTSKSLMSRIPWKVFRLGGCVLICFALLDVGSRAEADHCCVFPSGNGRICLVNYPVGGKQFCTDRNGQYVESSDPLTCAGDPVTCCKRSAKFWISAIRTGPPAQMDIMIQDAEQGLGKIICRKLVNATMDMPIFPPGTKAPVTCTFTKIDPKLPAQVELASCSTEGCCQNGDPVLTVLRVAQGRNRVRESFSEIPKAERFVSVQNGSPGLQRLHIFVNGRRVGLLHLSDAEETTIDVAAHLRKENLVTLVGQGPAGSSGLVYIADMPGLPKATGMPYHIDWDPGFLPEEVDMHWGK